MKRRNRAAGLWAALLCALCLLQLASCGQAPEPEATAPPVTLLPATPPPETPAPTPEPPATTPDNPFAPLGTCAGIMPDGTFSDQVLFIGDSLTASLIARLRGLERLGGARYMAIVTYAMQSFYGAPFLNSYSAETYGMECSPEFYNLSYAQAVKQAGDSVGVIYFMLGTNASREVTAEYYEELMLYLRECCPDAMIYAQTIPYSKYELSDYEGVNAAIVQAVEARRAVGDRNLFVLDTCSAFGSRYVGGDGLHLTIEGLDVWYSLIAGDLVKE